MIDMSEKEKKKIDAKFNCSLVRHHNTFEFKFEHTM